MLGTRQARFELRYDNGKPQNSVEVLVEGRLFMVLTGPSAFQNALLASPRVTEDIALPDVPPKQEPVNPAAAPEQVQQQEPSVHTAPADAGPPNTVGVATPSTTLGSFEIS